MSPNTEHDVVCYLQCSWCRRKAIGITQASAERAVSAYLAHLDNMPLAEQAACYARLSPSMYHYQFCRHGQEPSEYLLQATITSERTLAKAQRVVAPAIPFALPEELRDLSPD
jgi:hypothetical protein